MGWWDYAKWAVPGVNAYYGLKALSASPARDAMQRAGAGYEQRGGQLDTLAGQLQQQALGQGPSLAQEQLRQALDQNVSAQRAMAASARPGQQGLATRLMAQQAGQLGAQTAAQGAQARLAEQQGAQQQLGQVLLGARGQDASMLGAAAAQPTTGEKFLSAGLGVLGAGLMSDVRAKQNITPGTGSAGRLLNGLERGLVDMPDQVWDAEEPPGMGGPPPSGPGRGVYTRPGSSNRQRLGAALMGAAPILSDRERKQNTRAGGGLANQLMDAVRPATYEYKASTGLPPGRRLGVMAQEIERAAPEAVINTPAGKMVDYNKLGPAILASLGELNRRTKLIEAERIGSRAEREADQLSRRDERDRQPGGPLTQLSQPLQNTYRQMREEAENRSVLRPGYDLGARNPVGTGPLVRPGSANWPYKRWLEGAPGPEPTYYDFDIQPEESVIPPQSALLRRHPMRKRGW